MTIFSGAIKLNLENASFHKGIFVESSLVLAEGEFDDGILNVTAFGFPPTEPASKTRDYYGTTNFFGGRRATNVGSSERLSHLEMKSENSICVLSDVRFGKDFSMRVASEYQTKTLLGTFMENSKKTILNVINGWKD